ncbi:N-lysine methyltransferase KMT5A-like [Clytia hemisphaerica]|uniref:N-lysine methyltransferase KMT5A-like n=1 Tax=Clytia hemisphaerica TaxID=252671 RepID=UPI0034D6BBBC
MRRSARTYKKEIFVNEEDGFEKKFINDSIGYGVITKERFSVGDLLLTYPGEKITKSEGDRRLAEYPSEVGSFLFFYNNDCFDATYSEGLGRFVNHSSKHANAVAKMLDGKIWLKALKNLPVGSEIRYNYGVKSLLWKETDKPSEQFLLENNALPVMECSILNEQGI